MLRLLFAFAGLGVVLAFVKLVYSFFPLFNVIDLLVFGVGAFLLVRRFAVSFFVAALILSLPATAMSLYFVSGLGMERISSGVGTGWLVSAIAIPISALIGSWFGARRPALR